MARKIIESCPTCNGQLEITQVKCVRCGTEIRSRYSPCDFCRLSEEQSHFLWIFVTNRGNLSEVEKRLGVSYPTVRAKLDEIIDQLRSHEPEAPVEMPAAPRLAEVPAQGAYSEDEESSQAGYADRRTILDAVARGELSPAEGAARIRGLGGRR